MHANQVSRVIHWANDRLKKLPYPEQLVVFFLLSYVPIIVFVPAAYLLSNAEESMGGPRPGNILAILIAAPILETILFQWLVFKLLRYRWFGTRPVAVIFLSAVLFGLVHFYSPLYVLWAFLQGIVLALVYYFYLPNTTKAFWSTAIIHSLKNFTAALIAGDLQRLP